MRIFGMVGVLVVLAVVGLLVSKQMKAISDVKVPASPVVPSAGAAPGAIAPQGETVRDQAQSAKQQVKDSVESSVLGGASNRREAIDGK